MDIVPAIDNKLLHELSHDVPQFRNYLLLEPRILPHPNCTTPTWMRQREILETML